MNNNSKNFLKGLLVFCLVAAIGVAELQPLTVQAANKALSLSYKFTGQSLEEDGEECDYNNNYAVTFYGTSKKTAIKKLKLGAEVYIPKKALDKEGALVNVTPYLDLMSANGECKGGVVSRISITAINAGGEIKLFAWDDVKQKNTKSAAYATCKAGTGAYKSYYVIKLKNIPFQTKMVLENEKFVTIKNSTKYAFNIGLNILGESDKGSGTLYIDNVKVTSGKKAVVNYNFNKAPDFYNAYNRGKDVSAKKIKIKNF